MSHAFPEPTGSALDRREVLLGYLDYFRAVVVDRVSALDPAEATTSRLPTGWSPVELAHHLTHVERRWLDWGFLGARLDDPWADERDGRWSVPPGSRPDDVLADLRARGVRTRATVLEHDLDEVGAPSPRWRGAPPATLERVLLHLLQEYARHAGHLDVAVELAGGPVGE